MLEHIPYCFNLNEIKQYFNNTDCLNSWLRTRIKNKSIKRVRNGLYVSLDSMGQVTSTKYEIGSKVTGDCFISYHSALEYYGCANQTFNTLTISTKSRFTSFEFDGIEYECKISKNNVQIKEYSNVMVSSLERTIIDCIDDISLSGGIEEILNALEQIKYLDEKKLIEVLDSYNKIILHKKVGFLLELFKESLSLSNDFFDYCVDKLSNHVDYLLNDYFNDIGYISKWKLMAPVSFESYFNGGIK